MPEVSIKITGEIERLKGPGSRHINKFLKEKVLPVVMETVANEVKSKAREHASGVSLPPQKLPNQANHPIGQSESGNELTNFLERSIELNQLANSNYEVIATTTYASWVEFGTGIFGPVGQKIKPVEKQALKFSTPNFGTMVTASVKGQRPQPFMRGAIWFIVDNPSEIIGKIQLKLDKL